MDSTGKVFGIPYDFRRPTFARIKQRMWNTEEQRIVVPRVFGIGWTINLASLKRKSKIGFLVIIALYLIMAVNMVRSIKRGLARIQRGETS